MLPCKRPAVFLIIWAVILTSLTACANSPVAKNLEESLAADPKLQSNPVVFGESQSNQPQAQQNESTVQLPADFPKDIPLYSNAKLQEVTPASGSENKISTRWLSSDPSNFIASFYRSQFQTNNWQILQQPTDDTGNTFEARRSDLLLKVSIQPKSVTNATPNQPQTATELLIDYVPNSTAIAQPTSITNPNETANAVPQPGNSQFIGPILPTNSAAQPPSTANNQTIPTATSKSQVFNDLNKAPQEWQQHIQDLAALGVLSIETKTTKSNSTTTTNQFEPSKIVTHREYARWLIAANNAVYANNPAKQIRLASESTQPAFSDVSAKDPDFPAIQGLAEAGLIPSPLSGDSTVVLFRPDAPLTREQLLLWKLPLDTRQALPSANLDAVKQTWGFQDVAKIDPKALRAVLADYQNGEQSNIRRVFGYTTLFQPKKPVTRAEAATALWYFGSQGEGVSATEALKLKQS
ncbi:MAG: S-layer homology domain-containing protein [Nostoc sp. DedQUE08]|uniref:S-layer homology domain-containing protein n=1 Tax=unclassified Nostoc TaxID=2593658 RepID=UPI002AD3B6F8|nr:MULTISPECIES: S-layer homology domain-containing protein [unclassified Nostoc]MDZ8070232.1 S-layer homology domain-containing protein [Nostoc sp. DedQUE08]MDZ8090633.1 S-layer homology domain-containing protein [Nostoc sp. DedQUE05]